MSRSRLENSFRAKSLSRFSINLSDKKVRCTVLLLDGDEFESEVGVSVIYILFYILDLVFKVNLISFNFFYFYFFLFYQILFLNFNFFFFN